MPPISPKAAYLKVIVGSNNPVKVNAVRASFSALYPENIIDCTGMHAPSAVADQPMTASETRPGAINRVEYCRLHVDADFYVAIEGGVDVFEDGPATFAYVVITDHKQQSIGCSARLPLPQIIYQALLAGEELGHVMDRVFNTDNINQKGGAIALLTNHQATRESTYIQALLLAMAPFLNHELYTLSSAR